MNERMQIIIVLGVLLLCLVGLILKLIELKTPRYMKPRSFFKMYDDSDGLLSDDVANKVIVTHHYTKDLFVDD